MTDPKSVVVIGGVYTRAPCPPEVRDLGQNYDLRTKKVILMETFVAAAAPRESQPFAPLPDAHGRGNPAHSVV
jgi:hypothetical protein